MDYGHVVISTKKKNFSARVIRLFTQSKYSHSLITLPSICGEEMGLEAVAVGVTAVPMRTHYRENPHTSYRIYRFKADQKTKDQAIARSLMNLQKGYGYLELFWFAWRAINRAFGREIRSQDNWSQAGIICAELVASYITESGHPNIFAEYGLGSVHAQDVFEKCEAHPDIFELIETKE